MAMEKYGAVRCPKCKRFQTEKVADCTALVNKGELVKTATANPGEVFRCLLCQEEFTLPSASTDSDEKSE